MSRRTLNITFLADEWTSSKGGLSAMDRELAIQLAKNPDVSVNFFLPKCSYEDKRVAASHNIVIVEAEERPGYEPIEWLAFLPKDLVVDIVIGHGVVLGKQAQVIRYYRDCKWVQVVHTAPDELAMHKTCSGAISKGDQKQWVEIKLCQIADLVVAVGPKLMEFYSAFLSSCGKKVYNFTPGIFADFSPLKFPFQSGKKFRLLVLGRGDPEDFELKGYDIVSQAVAKLNDKSFHLTFVGASSESETQLANDLIKQGLCRSQLIVKGNLKNREDLRTMLCASNLVIMPSRTEGFGLTALEALSAGVPFLVSQNSGFGEALQEVPFGSYCVVDSEDPEAWAEAIKGVRQKGSEKVLQECGELRTHYAKKYSWETQCDDLVRVIMTLLSDQLLITSGESAPSSDNIKLLRGNEEELALPKEVLDSLSSMSCGEVVAGMKESLQLEGSLEQPDPETKKWIRRLVKEAKCSERLDVVKHLREITPPGTTGPLLSESLDVRIIHLSKLREVTITLSGIDEWMLVAEKLGLNSEEIRYLDKRTLNPADALLSYIANQRYLTVGELYEVLCDCGVPVIADKL